MHSHIFHIRTCFQTVTYIPSAINCKLKILRELFDKLVNHPNCSNLLDSTQTGCLVLPHFSHSHLFPEGIPSATKIFQKNPNYFENNKLTSKKMIK